MDIHGVLTQKYGCINRGWRTNRRKNTINGNLQGGFNQKKLWGMIWGYNFGDTPWELPSPISPWTLGGSTNHIFSDQPHPPSPEQFHRTVSTRERRSFNASLRWKIWSPAFDMRWFLWESSYLTHVYIYIYTHTYKYRICFATNGCESRTNGIKHHYNT